jgi:hypothetical protein
VTTEPLDEARGRLPALIGRVVGMPMNAARRYTPRHRASRFRGRVVRVLVRPSPKRGRNNVLCEDTGTGVRFVCPWRGLRRVDK